VDWEVVDLGFVVFVSGAGECVSWQFVSILLLGVDVVLRYVVARDGLLEIQQ